MNSRDYIKSLSNSELHTQCCGLIHRERKTTVSFLKYLKNELVKTDLKYIPRVSAHKQHIRNIKHTKVMLSGLSTFRCRLGRRMTFFL